jgi:predicted esterase
MLIPSSLICIAGCSKHEDHVPFVPVEAYSLHDVEYGMNTDTSGLLQHLILDLYSPPKTMAGQKFPLVLMIHGGSYQIGNKEWPAISFQILNDSGFIAVSIDYRLGWRWSGGCYGDTCTLEEAQYRGMQDANAALRYLVAHADEYSIDPKWIFVEGESAGAAIALNSSYNTDADMQLHHPALVQKLGSLHHSGNHLKDTYKISGICNKWGSLSDSNLITAATAIPRISFHGTNDQYVPVDKGYFLGCPRVPAYGSLCLYRRLLAVNSPAVLHLKQGGMHQLEDYTAEFTMSRTALFFHQVMAGTAASVVYVE